MRSRASRRGIGLEKYYPGASQTDAVHPGHFTGTGIGNTTASDEYFRGVIADG